MKESDSGNFKSGRWTIDEISTFEETIRSTGTINVRLLEHKIPTRSCEQIKYKINKMCLRQSEDVTNIIKQYKLT